MSIYTRRGDKGKTSLASGLRVLKSDIRVDVCGTIDELNSLLGVVLSIKYEVLSIKRELIKIQNDLLEIGSKLVSQGEALQGLKKRVREFENLIDEMTVKMPKLGNFVLPGGGETGSMLHLSRAVCRRAERKVVTLGNKQKIDSNIVIYLNRLSDLLFTMARFANFKEKKKEIIWKGINVRGVD